MTDKEPTIPPPDTEEAASKDAPSERSGVTQAKILRRPSLATLRALRRPSPSTEQPSDARPLPAARKAVLHRPPRATRPVPGAAAQARPSPSANPSPARHSAAPSAPAHHTPPPAPPAPPDTAPPVIAPPPPATPPPAPSTTATPPWPPDSLDALSDLDWDEPSISIDPPSNPHPSALLNTDTSAISIWELLHDMLDPAQGAQCIEVVDATQEPIAEIFAVGERVCCAVFFQGAFVIEPSGELPSAVLERLARMATTTSIARPWTHDPSWDWSGVRLRPEQARALAHTTAGAIARIAQAPEARGAYLRAHAITLRSSQLPAFTLSDLTDALTPTAPPPPPPLDPHNPAVLLLDALRAHSSASILLLRHSPLSPAQRVEQPALNDAQPKPSPADDADLAQAIAAVQNTLTRAGLSAPITLSAYTTQARDALWLVMITPTHVALARLSPRDLGIAWGRAVRLIDAHSSSQEAP